MTENKATPEGGHDDGATKKLPEPNEKGEVAPTTSPANDNHAGQPELITQKEFITAPSPVDAEASATGEILSSPLASDRDAFDHLECDQVLSEVETIDEAHEILENLNCYGSRYEPGGSADVESDGLEYLRAVCGLSCES